MSAFLTVIFVGLALTCLVVAVIAFAAHMPDPADAQPDYTPLDEWEPDPVDAADDTLPDWISRLRDDMTACEADGLISEIYRYLERADQ